MAGWMIIICMMLMFIVTADVFPAMSRSSVLGIHCSSDP